MNAHSTKALDSGMQRHGTAYVATDKLSIRMPIASPMQEQIQLFSVANAKTKTQLKFICQMLHFAYKIQHIFTIQIKVFNLGYQHPQEVLKSISRGAGEGHICGGQR